VIGDFWNSVGSSLAERWTTVSVPALLYWLSGLLAWTRSHGGLNSLAAVSDWADGLPTLSQATVIVIVLLAIAASGIVVQLLSASVLRLLEGYWPPWFSRLRRRLSGRLRRRAKAEDRAYQELAAQIYGDGTATDEQLAAFARLERRQRRRPSDPDRFMPTKVGNILRAAEMRPFDKYGLDSVALWPHLWLLLPDTSRRELASARAGLDRAVAGAVWGLLFWAFAPWTALAVPVGAAVATAAVIVWVPSRAQAFGDLVDAAFDLHRTTLYTQLRWPLPSNPKEERELGQQLTAYVWRGSDEATPTFCDGASANAKYGV
jgi:hypothetical protein